MKTKIPKVSLISKPRLYNIAQPSDMTRQVSNINSLLQKADIEEETQIKNDLRNKDSKIRENAKKRNSARIKRKAIPSLKQNRTKRIKSNLEKATSQLGKVTSQIKDNAIPLLYGITDWVSKSSRQPLMMYPTYRYFNTTKNIGQKTYELINALSNTNSINDVSYYLRSYSPTVLSALNLTPIGQIPILNLFLDNYGQRRSADVAWDKTKQELKMPFAPIKAYYNLTKAKRDPKLSEEIGTAIWSQNTMGAQYHNPSDFLYAIAYPKDAIYELPGDIESGGGTSQRTFLLDRDLQEQEFIKDGWVKGKEGDYHLVKKAVGNRNFPVWQTKEDAISREQLIPIANLDNDWLGDMKIFLPHPGSFPSTIYMTKDGKRFFQKATDLNDYGGIGGATSRFGGVFDAIGNPTVVTTGYQPINPTKLLNVENYIRPVDQIQWNNIMKNLKESTFKNNEN